MTTTFASLGVPEALVKALAAQGKTEPFPYGDERFGVPQRNDLHFVILEKAL